MSELYLSGRHKYKTLFLAINYSTMGKFVIDRLIIAIPLFLVVAIARAQAEKDSLENVFARYQSQTPQEKLFVHIDKTFYLAGETIWFKIYSLNAASNAPSSFSAIAYVELLDKDQKPVFQEKIAMDSAKGDGYCRLAPSLPSGNYIFRAYTNWMKNFSPDLYYQQQLTIVNTLTESDNTDTTGLSQEKIRFFPEGGNLVSGLTSTIAFKAINIAGNGVTCRGVVLDQKQDTVARFQSNTLGMGTFELTPVRGNTYSARVITPTSTFSENLPTTFNEGYVMHLSNSDGRNIRITVSTSATTMVPIVYLFANSRGQAGNARAVYLNNNQASFSVNPDSLGEGITHFTILNSNRQPVCERLWFKPAALRQMHIDVKLNPTTGTREKFTIDLTTSDPMAHPTAANLSMSVFLLDSLQSIPEENILNYCWLSSDLRGRIESPGHYFATGDPSSATDIDNLMLTQGWSRFRWEDILKNKPGYFDFRPETSGLTITGKITDKRTNLPPHPTIAYLSVPGRSFSFSTTLSRVDGTLSFSVGKFYGSKEIIVQTNNRTDSSLHIEIANPFSDRFSRLASPESQIPQGAQHQLLLRSIGMQAENAYRPAEKHRLVPLPPADTIGFYGHPDLRYNLDDYTRFVTMDEVIREYVQDVRVRRNGTNAYWRVRNVLFNTFFEDDPLLLIDGVPVFDGDKMIEINPLKVRKIDVVSHRYRFGPSLTDGIVNFVTYDGDLGGYQLDPSAVAVQYNGIQQLQEFYTPAYTPGAQNPLPDLRNQLLWLPEIGIDAKGAKHLSLFTSDVQGKYAVVVQGITPDGIPGYSVSTFKVSAK